MTITIDDQSGFCFGVTSAIKKAEEELHNGPLFCLGDIVHNGQEVARLERLGLETIDYDDLRTLHNVRVLLRAHGEPPSTYHIAANNGIEVIDATCPVVKKLQERIRQTYNQHRDAQIVIFGKVGHAEVIGLQGQTNNTAIIVENEKDLSKLDYTKDIYLFSQTTMSVDDFYHIVDRIKAILSTLETSETLGTFHFFDTICRNVANRVAHLQQFARENDVIFFVGGSKSSNAKVLFAHCQEANPNSFFLSSPSDLSSLVTPETFGTFSTLETLKIGICGATSTPTWLMEQVRDTLLNMQYTIFNMQ